MSNFLDDLRKMALTDTKKEEIKVDIKRLKESLFKSYVKEIVDQIKKEIETKVQKGEYVKSGTENILRSTISCKPEFDSVMDNAMVQKIKTSGFEYLEDDGYYIRGDFIGYDLSLQILKENDRYYCDFQHKDFIKVKEFFKAVRYKASEKYIKIDNVFFNISYLYKGERKFKKISFGDLVNSSTMYSYTEDTISKFLNYIDKTLCYNDKPLLIEQKICFDYSIKF